MAGTLITEIEQVTSDWLTETLRANGHLSRGRAVAVEKKPGPRAISIITPLEVRYSDDAPSSAPSRLIIKIPRPDTDRDGDDEIRFYKLIADQAINLPVIRCYDAAYSSEMGRFHLLLEDLSETHLSQPPSQLPPLKVYCEQIVDALAKVHAYWWNAPRLGKEVGELPTEALVKEEMAWAAKTFPAFADFLGDRLSDTRRAIFRRVLESLRPKLSSRLTSGNHLTLVHGDPHIGNFLYPRDPVHDTVRILDWKSYHVNIGLDDLAHMMAVFWFPERRARLEQELLRQYHNRLLEYGVTGYDWEICKQDYRLSVIRRLLYPMWQWERGAPPDIWWHHLERLMLAFDDLKCDEILSTHYPIRDYFSK